MDDFLKLWPKTVENAMLEHLEVDEETPKKVRGRGQLTLKKATPQQPNQEKKIKKPMMHNANEFLKQARRCEQLGHRIRKGREETKDKRKEYNNEAIQGIKKAFSKENKEDNSFGEKLERYQKGEVQETI